MMLGFLELKGKDAGDFLHRVTAGTVKGVAVGAGKPGLLLDGRSRVLATFELLRTEDQKFLLASVDAPALGAALAALHFSEDLEILQRPERAGVGLSSSQVYELGPLPGNLSWPSPVPGYRYSLGGGEISPEFHFERIKALVPWPQLDFSPDTPALEAGMLPWIDRFKGCYPGQEVVELSLNVGHPVRVLVAVESSESVSPGKIPWCGAEALVTSVQTQGGVTRALVRVPWAKKDENPPSFIRLHSHW